MSVCLVLTACRTEPPVTIRAGLLIDGTGGQTRDAVITIQRGRIRSISPSHGEPVTWDFGDKTVLPGLIDAHVHIAGFINSRGRVNTGDSVSRAEHSAGVAASALATLRGGFTTVASMGSDLDLPLRDAIDAGRLPGPRILSSLDALTDPTLTGPELRRRLRRYRANGADFVKVLGTSSVARGGLPLFSLEQLTTICVEARRAGSRSVIHAQSDTSIRLAIAAGCDQIEHGFLASRAILEEVARSGLEFDPQCRLVVENYLEHRAALFGMATFDSAGFAYLEAFRPRLKAAARLALSVPGVSLLFGSDATAGAHGRNGDDLVCRVREGGQEPMDALVTATSRNAAALGLGTEIGRIAPGYRADLIAVDGDPVREIEAIRRVIFVMKGGQVFVKP